MDNYDQTKTLIDVAKLYIDLGYSVIPVRENKSPAFSWKSNQTVREDIRVLSKAIENRNDVAGIGIVTGEISQLAVLDFDDLNLYYAFKEQYPQLTETYRVRTRRGCHLYYHIDKNLIAQTRKCSGVDWLHNGCYVVAPPSIISGFEYHIAQAGLPHRLSGLDLNQIHQFLDAQRTVKVVPDRAGESATSTLLPDDAVRLYKQYAEAGRNNALFRVAILARDCGWSRQTTEHLLLDIFTMDRQGDEPLRQRYAEGQRTIASAFSRPPRIRLVEDEPVGLPNTIREAFLARGMTCAVRTLDALRQKGLIPGSQFTEAMARDLLAGLIGNHSVRETLHADICPKTKHCVARQGSNDPTSLCFEISQTTSELIPRRGRKTYVYTMPSNLELAEWLGIKLTRISDPLSEADLATAKKTRKAMHRELLKRRPGVYPSRWLAKRLHISVRTKNRYDREIPVHKEPTYRSFPITWHTLGTIPEDETPGTFLEDDRGKRYPAKIDLAKALLGRGRAVLLRVQSHNFYCVDNPLAIHHPNRSMPHEPFRFHPEFPSRSVSTYPQKRAQKRFLANSTAKRYPPTESDLNPLFQEYPEEASTFQKTLQQSYKVPLPKPAEEQCAHRVYKTVQKMGQTSFSLVSARRLVDHYGSSAARHGLQRLKSKKNVSNPAGFLTVVTRSYDKI